MRTSAAAIAMVLIAASGLGFAQTAEVAASRDITLTLPHPLAPGELAWLSVQVGRIGPGQEIDVTTASGQSLGTISPFGLRLGREAGTFTLPVPADAIRDARIVVRLTISQAGAPPRAPNAEEVRSVTLGVAAASR